MKKKVLIINQYMHIGGVENALLSLLYSLKEKAGYDVSLMLIAEEGEFLKYVPNEINLVRAPFKEVFNNSAKDVKSMLLTCLHSGRIINAIQLLFGYLILKLFKNDSLYSKSVFEGEKKEYDYVLNFPGPNDLTSTLAERRITSQKKFIWVHNEFSKAGNDARKYMWRFKKYDKVFAVSETCCNELKEALLSYSDKFVTLYNIINPVMYHSMADGEDGFTDSYKGLRILTVGRLSYQKGLDIAIDAACILNQKKEDFKWYIIGEGEERVNLEQKIKENQLEERVILMGARDNPYPYFRDCDIYVQPSRFEGYGLVVAEAKAFYKPVICTEFAGAFEQIESGTNGIIVKCDANEISLAICNLINDGALMSKIVDNLKNTSVSTEKEIEKLISFFNAT